MNKLTRTGLFFLAFSSIAPAVHADTTRYISDELSTWVRSGPGDQYRLVGKLNAGEQVTLLQSSPDTKYAEIRDSQGRTNWIPLSQLSETPSLRTQVPQLQQQVKDLTDKLANIDTSWNQRTADMQKKVAGSDGAINTLKQENQNLKNALIVAQKKVDAANVQLDDKQRAIIMQWFMYGGGVMGLGLLIGLLLPRMMPRRKSNDRWMR
ncbi:MULTISPECIES: TIGR04211 family SH3 domain-containing protein [Tatumella]|uniref:TIGR04211 family SH3 domain-containing protein n=1 Tax=Tatumella punctata TaxID=399969 RepID=A0ABW1VPK7_9GAMM|nr:MULTISPECIES: TIGR04211 family SH3 domain-containing protein [unclassified Tatumella]MBS0855742.1 SH3 domain-containing protein [Tatumella sp. JGM16]MBS0877832.1 SH3 domain-containing protein [Tatumella sp. JGM82]MBS0891537.1 SH3 domain-containing protein [Tatumella sp. JGM94]MBS0894376.1 SH3 domain-containing protein [Tatumella sp. JGM130]MBS0902467.1 SH3 domain-containing protein [Tatumella sp. JGM100]